jgi:hypothetical protein
LIYYYLKNKPTISQFAAGSFSAAFFIERSSHLY